MSDIAKIKVVPNIHEAVGMVHPVDGPLEQDGSLWSHDTFTMRRLIDQSIRRDEADHETVEDHVAGKAPAAAGAMTSAKKAASVA